MNNFKIILGEYFIANGFEVKVALKKGFENGHRTSFIEVFSEHLKSGMKSNYKVPFYNSFITQEQFNVEVNKAKSYFCSPIQINKKVIEPMNLSGVVY